MVKRCVYSLCLVLFSIVTLTSCDKDNDSIDFSKLIGTWKSTTLADDPEYLDGLKAQYDQYKEDGTYYAVNTYWDGTYEVYAGGKWEPDGNKIRIIWDDGETDMIEVVSVEDSKLELLLVHAVISYTRVPDSEIEQYLKN